MRQTLDAASEAPPSRSRRVQWIVGCALILAGLGGLAVWGMSMPGAVSFFVTPSELLAKGDAAYAAPLRVGGHVEPGTLVRDGSSVSFVVTDGVNGVPVRFTGEVPDTLQEDTEVVAEGSLALDGSLEASRVLAKCSSRFESEDPDFQQQHAHR